jgi:dolichyl-phosphate-mannose-protein mannosyltransferase
MRGLPGTHVSVPMISWPALISWVHGRSAPRDLGGRTRQVAFWALWGAFLLAGMSFRLVQFFAARSLWLDESMLALNIASRPMGELLRPLDYNQIAPPLFLWLERLAIQVAGTNEMALRAWPMLAALALPPLLALLAYRWLGPAGSLATIALASLSPTLVSYANEAKPYGSDAFVTVASLAGTLAVRDRPTTGRWTLLLSSGVLGLLLSIPAAFVLPASLAALALEPVERRARLRWIAACGLAWAATLVALYLGIYRAAARNPYQQQGYDQAFLVPGPGFAGRALLALRGSVWPSFAGIGSHIPSLPDWALAITTLALAGGLIAIARRAGSAIAVLVALPLVLVTAASALRRYPLGVPRMMVFAAPLLILMAAGALSWIAARARPHARPALLVAAGLLALAPLARARLAEAKDPPQGEDARTLVAAFRERPASGEAVYVAARGMPSWLFYTTNWLKPDRNRLDFYARAASNGPSFENMPSRGRPVVDEGSDLVYHVRGRQELLGIASGRQWRWPSYVKAKVDEGWAANEARRIARAADPCTWMYFTHLSENANKPITWHLRDDYRGRVQTLVTAPGGVLYRYCFPRTPEQIERLERWKAELGK